MARQSEEAASLECAGPTMLGFDCSGQGWPGPFGSRQTWWFVSHIRCLVPAIFSLWNFRVHSLFVCLCFIVEVKHVQKAATVTRIASDLSPMNNCYPGSAGNHANRLVHNSDNQSNALSTPNGNQGNAMDSTVTGSLAYRVMLFRLDEDLVRLDILSLKLLCQDLISPARLERIGRGIELFAELEDRGLLAAGDYDLLAELLYHIQRLDLLGTVPGHSRESVRHCIANGGSKFSKFRLVFCRPLSAASLASCVHSPNPPIRVFFLGCCCMACVRKSQKLSWSLSRGTVWWNCQNTGWTAYRTHKRFWPFCSRLAY